MSCSSRLISALRSGHTMTAALLLWRARIASSKAVGATATVRRLATGAGSNDGIVDTARDIAHYKSDTQTLARWLDVSVVKKKGRAFESDGGLLPAKGAQVFPRIKGYSLNCKDVVVPDSIIDQATSNNSSSSSGSSKRNGSVRLLAFSFKHYGFTLVRTWLTPFLEKFGKGPLSPVPAIEVCFVEYGFLSLTKNVFATNLKSQVDAAQHDLTALSFGGVMDFAAQLQLPNKYTGYVYLVDGKNRVRWRGCGTCNGIEELEVLYKAVADLQAEEALELAPGTQSGGGKKRLK